MGWESFFLAAAERKGTRKTERNGTGLVSDNDDDDGDRRNLSSYGYCSEENGNQTESRVEMKRDEMRAHCRCTYTSLSLLRRRKTKWADKQTESPKQKDKICT